MTKYFDADGDGSQGFTEAEVARIVLELDREVMLDRRAAALRQIVHGRSAPLPLQPTHTELAVLAALAQTYGPGMLSDEFAPIRAEISELGAVSLVCATSSRARKSSSTMGLSWRAVRARR